MAVVVGLIGWGIVARLGAPPPHEPAAAPPLAPITTATDSAPPYRSSFLDGHWRSAPLGRAAGGARAGERLTLLIRGSALVLWAGTTDSPEQRIVAYDAVFVRGHRVQLRPVGVAEQVGRYRWDISHEGLQLHPLPGTDRPGHRRLVTQLFSRA